MVRNEAEQRKFTGTHMAIIMVAFFSVIIAVNLTMATFANRSWTGLVVKNSYVESQHFNAKLEKAREQEKLNWSGVLAQSQGGISFKLLQADGNPVLAEKVVLVIGRPATETLDQKVELKSMGAGLYKGDFKLGAGLWAAEIVADISAQVANNSQWRMNYNFFVKSDGSFDAVSNKAK